MSPIYNLCSTFMNPGAHTLGMALLIATFFPVGSFISSALLGWLDNRLQNEASTDGCQRTDGRPRAEIMDVQEEVQKVTSKISDLEIGHFFQKLIPIWNSGYLLGYVFFISVPSLHLSVLLRDVFKLILRAHF